MPGGTRRLVCAVLTLIVISSGCGGDDYVADEGSDTSYEGSSSSQPPFEEDAGSAGPDEGCTERYPLAVDPVPETPEEADYVDDFVVCTDGEYTSIQNKSPAVWRLSNVSSFSHSRDTQEQAFFRSLMSSSVTDDLLLPESTVVAAAPPEGVRWFIDGASSAGWALQSAALEVMEGKAQSQLSDVFGEFSPRAQALATCVLAASQIWQAREKLLSPTGADDILSGIGLFGDATQCRMEWTNADDAIRARRIGAVTTSFDDLSRDLLTSSKPRTTFQRVVSTFGRWARSGRLRVP